MDCATAASSSADPGRRRTCPVSKVDRRVPWGRIRIFGASGIGPGPVYPGLGATSGLLNAVKDTQYGGRWEGEKVFWYVAPSYRGRVLIRGGRLDGPGWLGFNGTRVPKDELRIEPYDTVKLVRTTAVLARDTEWGSGTHFRLLRGADRRHDILQGRRVRDRPRTMIWRPRRRVCVAWSGENRLMAPAGIEPAHGASKAPALSSELRGRAASQPSADSSGPSCSSWNPSG